MDKFLDDPKFIDFCDVEIFRHFKEFVDCETGKLRRKSRLSEQRINQLFQVFKDFVEKHNIKKSEIPDFEQFNVSKSEDFLLNKITSHPKEFYDNEDLLLLHLDNYIPDFIEDETIFKTLFQKYVEIFIWIKYFNLLSYLNE